MIPVKTEYDLRMMREAGKTLALILEELKSHIKAGITTLALDAVASESMKKQNVVSAFKGYNGYPAHVCVSVNEEIVHGIPGDRRLREGDIVSIDAGINHRGYFADAAVTVPVGKIDISRTNLLEVTQRALGEGIKQARCNNRLFDISNSIQQFVERNGYSVVRQFVGHGIGKALHEEPEIPNFGAPAQGPVLKSGMVFALEPMVNMGSWEARVLSNGWTAVTVDGAPSAHFEHTVAITERGPEILTAA